MIEDDPQEGPLEDQPPILAELEIPQDMTFVLKLPYSCKKTVKEEWFTNFRAASDAEMAAGSQVPKTPPKFYSPFLHKGKYTYPDMLKHLRHGEEAADGDANTYLKLHTARAANLYYRGQNKKIQHEDDARVLLQSLLTSPSTSFPLNTYPVSSTSIPKKADNDNAL